MVRVHAELELQGRQIILRDLLRSDLPRIADYWSGAEPEFLERLDVDGSRFGGREGIIARFEPAIPSGDPKQAKLAFAIDLDGAMVGYTNLNRYGPTENYSHWHIIDPQWRKSGLSTLLYPYRMRAYFSCAPIDRLVHQTRPENIGVNRLLDRFVPIAETIFVAKPDGLSLPGIFNLRYVSREDLPRIMAIAAQEGAPHA
jgi:RimJ/RimL family protein N-acetyltransferase